MYTVKQLADLAGVTIRTLHHYDRIGLLKPSSVGGNGYRYYDEPALYRLQQVLFYRELGMPLEEIGRIIARRGFDRLTALRSHRAALESEVKRLRRLIRTIDETTKHLEGKTEMNPKELFAGFSEEEQEKLAAEAEQKWDPQTVRDSNRRWKAYSPEEKSRILEQGSAVYTDLARLMPRGDARPASPASPEVQAVIARWHKHLLNFWSPSDQQLLGLADLYNDDPRFRANYEKIAPGLAEFMRKAVKAYVAARK